MRLKGAKTGRCRFRHQRVADKGGGAVTAAVQGVEKQDQRRE